MPRLDQLFNFSIQQIEEDLLLARIRAIDFILFHVNDAASPQLTDYRLVYDKTGRVTSFTHIDDLGHPVASHFGYVTARCHYLCDRGHIRQVTLCYFDESDQPTVDELGQHRVVYSFDKQHRITQMDWRNDEGFGTSRDNVSRMMLEWDEEILRVRYFDNQGQLSTHYQYVFDELGQYIRLRMGLDDGGALTTDDDGGNGSWIERDQQTHAPIALWNINLSRQRIQAVDGVAYWRMTFLPPNTQRLMYFNANGVAMTNHEGTYGYETVFDKFGNMVEERYLDADGRPMPNCFGIVRYIFQQDDLGRIVEVHAFGLNDLPVANAEGVHAVHHTYDDTLGQRSMLIRKYDVEGNLITSGVHSPYITRYLSATETLQYNVNEDGSLAPNSMGHKIIVHRIFDECGRPLVEDNRLPDGTMLVPLQGDVCGFKYSYDERHRQVRTMAIGSDGKPALDEAGVSVYITQVDRWGRLIRQNSLDLEQQPVANDLGDCGTGFEYDEEGNTTWISLDADGRPHANLKGYTYYLLEKDSFGRDVRELWYDAQRRPFVSPAGDSGLMSIYMPNAKEIVFLDANGDPHENLNGVAILHQEFDEKNREVYEVRYNMDGDKVQLPDGYYAMRTEYHSDQPGHRTLICLDANDHPVDTLRGCAYLEQWLDAEGHLMREIRYDADHLPAIDDDGVCGNTFRILEPVESFGRSELVGQLDADGHYVADDTGLVYWRVDTDSLGRVVRKSWFDMNEQPCRDSSGTYGIEFIYEESDTDGIRPREERYLSRKGRLMNNKWGYAAVLIIYDVALQEHRVYFDKNGKFVNPDSSEE